jgi:hypothetical protein
MIADLLYYLGLILCDFVLLAFRSFGDFVLLEFWWLEVTRRCGEVVLWWRVGVSVALGFCAVGLWLMLCVRVP